MNRNTHFAGHDAAVRGEAPLRSKKQKKLAFWFRYGPAEHTELFHALPRLIEVLAQHCEVHYYGLKSDKPIPPPILANAVVHHLPAMINRASVADKIVKTLLWYFWVPWIALRCRTSGINAVFVDETLPGLAWLGRIFFNPQIAMMVADFFGDVYLARCPLGRPLRSLIRAIDFAAWRKLPVIFTRTKYTTSVLARHGIPEARMHVVYDPCDFSLYHPLPDKSACKARFGYAPDELVLVHHGILHPNKGNDRIIAALAGLKNELPQIRLLLVGSGPEENRLKKLTRDLKVHDLVRFTGWLPTPQKVNLALNAADIGLVMRVGHESDHFHITGTLVHNMACGLPLLAARLAGICEIVREGETGLLFDATDMHEFTAKLKMLASDPRLRARLGNAAHSLALQLFDLESVARQTALPLLSLLGIKTDLECCAKK
ncbi:MAG: glycosyltransferase family 4 protein [Kiritimatiellia bacterium]